MSVCDLWQGALTPDGYPRRTYRGNHNTRWHRVVYCQSRGLPLSAIEGIVIRHTCDVRRCINEDHLISGTHLDNMRDRSERGRHRCQKLMPWQVLEIVKRPDTERNVDIANEFGVNPRTISSIRLRKHFKWLLGG